MGDIVLGEYFYNLKNFVEAIDSASEKAKNEKQIDNLKSVNVEAVLENQKHDNGANLLDYEEMIKERKLNLLSIAIIVVISLLIYFMAQYFK